MSSRADRIISALRSGHDDLVALLAGVAPDDLTRASGAAEWTVAQVLSHLGSGSEIHLAALDAALGGPKPPEDFNKGVWARWDGRSPAEQAAAFPVASEELVRRYESLDAAAREELRIDLGFLPLPVDVATAAGLRLSEFTLHAWDVRVAFDPAATLAPEATAPLLDGVGLLLGFLGRTDRLPRPAELAVVTTGPERSFGLSLSGTAALTDDPPEKPDGTLTAPAEYFLRLVTGRHATAHTPVAVVLESDVVTLDDLRAVFPGF